MNNFLFDENPLVIQPQLANVLGLNEAIILQQMNYWLKKSSNTIDGRKWIYNTYKSWQEQFSFYSVSTIRRTIGSLESSGLVISANHNKAGFDKTKWYTIDYQALSVQMQRACVQNEQSSVQNEQLTCVQNEQMERFNLDKPIPETTRDYTETTSDTLSSSNEHDRIPYKEIIDYLNEIAGTKYKPTAKATQRYIKARFNDGFELDDFKAVIKTKSDEWKNDVGMVKYLRPETLFGTKFEGYLNQKRPQQSQTSKDDKFDDWSKGGR